MASQLLHFHMHRYRKKETTFIDRIKPLIIAQGALDGGICGICCGDNRDSSVRID
jgi:hypothetical protein